MISWRNDKSGCNDNVIIIITILMNDHNGHRVGLVTIIIVLVQTYWIIEWCKHVGNRMTMMLIQTYCAMLINYAPGDLNLTRICNFEVCKIFPASPYIINILIHIFVIINYTTPLAHIYDIIHMEVYACYKLHGYHAMIINVWINQNHADICSDNMMRLYDYDWEVCQNICEWCCDYMIMIVVIAESCRYLLW